MRAGVIDESTPMYADDRVVYALALAVIEDADLELVRDRSLSVAAGEAPPTCC